MTPDERVRLVEEAADALDWFLDCDAAPSEFANEGDEAAWYEKRSDMGRLAARLRGQR